MMTGLRSSLPLDNRLCQRAIVVLALAGNAPRAHRCLRLVIDIHRLRTDAALRYATACGLQGHRSLTRSRNALPWAVVLIGSPGGTVAGGQLGLIFVPLMLRFT